MELNLLDKGKDSIDIEFVDVDESTIYMLLQRLNSDKAVKEATYTTGHPMIDKPKMHVVVMEGKPQTALKRAARELARDFKQAKEICEKKA